MKISVGPVTFGVDEIFVLAQRAYKSMSGKEKVFSDYFRIVGSPEIDYCVYQLGLRPLIPVVDLVYLEYLNFLLKSKLIGQLFIFPSVDLSSPKQDLKAFNLLRQNSQSVFQSESKRVRFIDPFEQSSNLSSVSLLSKDFLKTIQYTSSENFLEYVRNQLGLDIKSYADFNRFHPEELRLVSTYVHLVRCYIIWKSLLSMNVVNTGRNVTLGFLIWETEVDKLGMFHKLSREFSEISITAVLGRSCMIKRNTPVPVYSEEESLNVFDKNSTIVNKLSQRSHAELRIYENILLTILRENYNFNSPNKVSEIEGFLKGLLLNLETLVVPSLNKRALRVLYYMAKLKELYHRN